MLCQSAVFFPDIKAIDHFAEEVWEINWRRMVDSYVNKKAKSYVFKSSTLFKSYISKSTWAVIL